MATKKTLEIDREISKMKSAIETIKDATQDLDAKYLGQYQNELEGRLIKLTTQAQKAQSDLHAAREMEALDTRKLQDAEIDFSKSESDPIEKINEADRIASNVSMTIEHIAKSYDEITTASKYLLKSSTSTRLGFEDSNPVENPTSEKFSKVAI